jgi:vacuolar-type H+-ATPase subunit B/Vma2
MGLHLNLKKVFEDNMKKTGVLRKNNFIINSNDNPNK